MIMFISTFYTDSFGARHKFKLPSNRSDNSFVCDLKIFPILERLCFPALQLFWQYDCYSSGNVWRLRLLMRVCFMCTSTGMLFLDEGWKLQQTINQTPQVSNNNNILE